MLDVLYSSILYSPNMEPTDISKKVRDLPVLQQVGLYFILHKLDSLKNESFKSSQFSQAMQEFIKVKDAAQHGKTIGGVLSSLSRNGLIERVSGGRDPSWIIAEEVSKKKSAYKKAVFDIKTYWVE